MATATKKYHFTAGDDRTVVQVCGTVKARTQREAVNLFRKALGEVQEGVDIPTTDERVEYIRVYFEPKILTRTHQDFIED